MPLVLPLDTATSTPTGPATPGTGRDLLLLLVGAALALAAQALLQLVIVPHVEARKRREDRWEKHVLELGELLSGELGTAARNFGHEAVAGTLLRSMKDQPMASRERYEAVVREHRTVLQEAQEHFTALADTRTSWLSRRVLSIAPGELWSFEVAWMRYNVTRLKAAMTADDGDEPEVRQAWADEVAARDNLLDEVETLASNGPPRRGPARVKRARRRVRIWMAERRRAAWLLDTPAGRRWRAEDRALDRIAGTPESASNGDASPG